MLFFFKCFLLSFFGFVVSVYYSLAVEDSLGVLIGGRSPRYFNTFQNLFIVAVHYPHTYMIYIVAIADCTTVLSTTAYIWVKDQLRPFLDMITIYPETRRILQT